METPTSRVLWKGAISFGLVHIPVALHSATSESRLDFDWLDKRTMDPIGYKRINKKTGKEVEKENIVKGISYEEGRYVVLTDDEIKAALPKSTQTVEIESFVSAAEIPLVFFERPYYLAPIGKGDKVYALLREALVKSRRVGIARVVIQTKQHLAALMPAGPALVLILLRWASEIRSIGDLNLPSSGAKSAGLTTRELAMASQLIEDMSAPWKPEKFKDEFSDEVKALVKRKVKAGKTEAVSQPETEPGTTRTADIIDLTELLQRSLRGKTAKSSDAGKATSTESRGAKQKTPRAKPASTRRSA
jgi:DNA end-binding protein Ku